MITVCGLGLIIQLLNFQHYTYRHLLTFICHLILAQSFSHYLKQIIMNQDKDLFNRNRPSDKGESNDPNTREESAQQPGASTYSSNDKENVNQELTRTAENDFSGDDFGADADAKFDEVNREDE